MIFKSNQLADNPSGRESDRGWNGFSQKVSAELRAEQRPLSPGKKKTHKCRAKCLRRLTADPQDITNPWNCSIKNVPVLFYRSSGSIFCMLVLCCWRREAFFFFFLRVCLFAFFFSRKNCSDSHSAEHCLWNTIITSHIPRHQQHPPPTPSELQSASEVTLWINAPFSTD